MIDEQLIPLRDAARMLGVSKKTLQRWDNSGKLKAVRLMYNRRHYRLSDVTQLIQGGTHDTNRTD